MADTPSTPPAPSPASPDEENARTCREQCRTRLAALRVVSEKLASPNTSFHELEAIDSDMEPLEIEERRQLKILLSWGGPSDGFVLTLDKAGRELLEGVYFHADWFTYAEERLSQADAELVADVYLHGNPSAYFTKAA